MCVKNTFHLIYLNNTIFLLIFLDVKVTKNVTFAFNNTEKNEVPSTEYIISVVRGRDSDSQQWGVTMRPMGQNSRTPC